MTTSNKTIDFVPVGVIFDVDDTLLDNYSLASNRSLHEQARFLALREVGAKHGITKLATVDRELNHVIVKRSKEHTTNSHIWQIFYELGLVTTDTINHSDILLNEIATRKYALYDSMLKEFGVPLPKAVEFVKAVSLLTDGRLAIASGAQHGDIMTFLEIAGLSDYFLPARIVSHSLISQAKPAPEAFSLAFKTINVPDSARAQVVAFEDDPKGIESAKRAGLFVCAITSRFSYDELMAAAYKPDLVRSTYVEFAKDFGVNL